MKNFYLILLICSISLFSINIYGQGNTCGNPYIISSLPFNYTGTTAGFGNDYSASGTCGGNGFITGDDFVFSYTASGTGVQNVSIALSNCSAPGGIGLYILDDCINVGTANCLGAAEPTTGAPVLDQVTLISGTTYYIFISTYNYLNMNPNTAFTIDVTELASSSDDCGITDISTSFSSCNLNATESVAVEITNFGTDPVSGFDVAYVLDGGAEVVELFSGSINPGATANYTFTATLDLSAEATYNIVAYTKLATDTVYTNDTLQKSVTHTGVISSYPYFENFESGAGGWIAEGVNSSWQLGSPTAPIINSAFSGSNSWATGLAGSYNNDENSYLLSPCFDFTSMANPVIEFKIWYEMDIASAYVEYSFNYGTSWTKVGDGEPADPDNWYNAENSGNTAWNGQISTDTWKTVWHDLAGLGGAPAIMIRIVFQGITSGILVEEGVAIDDIQIKEAAAEDLSVIGLVNPVSSCGLSTEPITIGVRNEGQSAASGFNVSYSIDNGVSYVTEAYAGSVAIGANAGHTFASTEDFSIPGIYNVILKVDYAADENAANDSMMVEVISFPSAGTGEYIQGFESDNGGWITSGANTTWDHGAPTGAIINTAATGSNAWCTNLNGNHATGEVSFLYSPCMDISGLGNPYVRFNLWTNAGNEPTVSGYMALEVSTNGGATWSTLGANGEGENWYNGSTFTGWVGNTGGWNLAVHDLASLSNYSNVQFRFAFNSVFGGSEGFGVDDFEVYDCTSPVSGFTYSANLGEITFTNATTDAISYLWNFGDGNTSTQQSPVHTYSADGTYIVSLVATNDCGTDTTVMSIDVSLCAPVMAGFTYSYSGNGFEISFQNTSSNADSYQWSYGDGVNGVIESPTHLYFADGSYDVTLIATSSCDADTLVQTIVITSVNEIDGSSFNVYPNPAEEKLFISIVGQTDIRRIDITSQEGKLIESIEVDGSQNILEVDVRELPVGRYILQINSDSGISSRSFLVK